MEINSLDDLVAIKNQIRTMIQAYRLDGILLGLRDASHKVDPFFAAGLTLFAVKHCTAGHPAQTQRPLGWNELEPLTDLVAQYLLADPLSFDEAIQQEYVNSNPIFTILRLAGNQMPYRVSIFGQYAQPRILFQEIPKEIAGHPNVPGFNFEAEFTKINHVSLTDFLSVAFVASAAAQRNVGFTRTYFDKARSQSLRLPNDKTLLFILDQMSADPKKFMGLYRHRKVSDRRFSMYDFNPLFVFPIVRPWRKTKTISMELDRMVAPLPKLIAFRTSMGIFYQMYNQHKEVFSKYFGYIFEAYIGRILENSLSSEILLSEQDIRRTYPEKKGKVPDWVIIDGDTAILVECKATRFSRAAITTGAEEEIHKSLKQVMKGLRQVHNFLEACKAKKSGLDVLHGCSNFVSVLVTLEPLYLINSLFFKEYINAKLADEGITDLSWLILSVEELEKLQPHALSGVKLTEILDELYDNKTFNTVLEEIFSKTGLTFRDSFLYKKHQELYDQLGFSVETHQN